MCQSVVTTAEQSKKKEIVRYENQYHEVIFENCEISQLGEEKDIYKYMYMYKFSSFLFLLNNTAGSSACLCVHCLAVGVLHCARIFIHHDAVRSQVRQTIQHRLVDLSVYSYLPEHLHHAAHQDSLSCCLCISHLQTD